MLNRHYPLTPLRRGPMHLSSRQDGVVLMIALIVLVALTLGGIALMRSVDTTNMISGNLAFQQSATRSGEVGTRDAIAAVIDAIPSGAPWINDFARGYSATGPTAIATDWNTYWTTTINPNPLPRPMLAAKLCNDRACTLQTDAAGNTVSYTIERLCSNPGDPKNPANGCATTTAQAPGDPNCPDCQPYLPVTQYLYRVTTHIAGPRNTVSYIQTIVAK